MWRGAPLCCSCGRQEAERRDDRRRYDQLAGAEEAAGKFDTARRAGPKGAAAEAGSAAPRRSAARMVARAHFRSFLGMSGARGTLQPSPLNNVFGRGPRSAVGPRISYVAAWLAPGSAMARHRHSRPRVNNRLLVVCSWHAPTAADTFDTCLGAVVSKASPAPTRQGGWRKRTTTLC